MASPLGKLFGRSPIAPIQMHMQLAEEVVQMLCELLTACADEEFERADQLLALMVETVSEARAERRKIRKHLPRGLMLAMPRPDLLELLDIQMRLAEQAKRSARPLVARRMSFPPGTRKALEQQASLIAACVNDALTAIRNLDEMLTQGFGQHESRKMEKMIASLDRQLDRCAAQRDKLRKQVVKNEGSETALDNIFQYQLVDSLAAIAYACGDVGEQLELLIAR